ncbi:MAG: hypothetical protein RIR62_2569 [Pseudomonadota bacterium]
MLDLSGAAAGRAWRVLVVDDSRAQRHLLVTRLRRWGYRVAEAASGEDALAICRASPPDIILSDWMMPGMTGPDLCRAFRALPREGYGYFILLTSKSAKDEVAGGLDLGADDFLTKPVDPQELHARMRAGERILGMQAELVARNRDLQRLYDALDRDLAQARKLQTQLVREGHRDLGLAGVTLMMRASGHVGGDMVGVVDLAPARVGLYALDVAGHGVAAAMMTARLGALLGGGSGSILRDAAGAILPPDRIADRLNRLMTEEFAVEQYFTMVWADCDLARGRLRLVQAGHPHPLLLRAGRVRRLGGGGFPVGLVAEATFRPVTVALQAGDRLLIPSDGITECPGPRGDFGERGLARLLRETGALGGADLPDRIGARLAAHAGDAQFPDDISALILDYRGPSAPDRYRVSIARSPSVPRSPAASPAAIQTAV